MSETVEAFGALKAAGKIRYWGVSNFDTDDMEEIQGAAVCGEPGAVSSGQPRGIEFDLLPWCAGHGIPVMAYSPLGHHVRKTLASPALRAAAGRHGVTAAQVAIAWGLRSGDVISIPKAADAAHVKENAAAAGLALTTEDLAAIDAEFPPPSRKAPLDLL